MHVHAFRLTPGTDLRMALERYAHEHGLRAGSILTCVGSLSRAHLRMPGAIGDAAIFRTLDEPMEIVSLTGTLGPDGVHIHISLARADGACIGGHLVRGCIVNTTAEVVIGEASGIEFRRRPDDVTGYQELNVSPGETDEGI